MLVMLFKFICGVFGGVCGWVVSGLRSGLRRASSLGGIISAESCLELMSCGVVVGWD